jgi:hypothetical protein
VALHHHYPDEPVRSFGESCGQSMELSMPDEALVVMKAFDG